MNEPSPYNGFSSFNKNFFLYRSLSIIFISVNISYHASPIHPKWPSVVWDLHLIFEWAAKSVETIYNTTINQFELFDAWKKSEYRKRQHKVLFDVKTSLAGFGGGTIYELASSWRYCARINFRRPWKDSPSSVFQ